MIPFHFKDKIMNTKQKIEIMQAYLDGKTIQYTDKSYENWKDLHNEPLWNFKECYFRIKPKQKVKKTINYHCFENVTGNLFYIREVSEHYTYYMDSNDYTRIPEFDKTREIGVEE